MGAGVRRSRLPPPSWRRASSRLDEEGAHPIGAYAVGVAMLVLGALGIEDEQMAHGSLLAIGGGLVLALPGLLDWLDIPKGTPARTTATVHLLTMLTATVVFAFTLVAQLDGYDHGEVETLALILGLAAEGLLTAGGYLGPECELAVSKLLVQPDGTLELPLHSLL